MDERDLIMDDNDLAWYEREDLRHAYYRVRIEMHEQRAKSERTGKMRYHYLEDDEDWTPVPMDAEFWQMVAGGLAGLRRYLDH